MLSILRKYAEKALCTKKPLSWGVTGKSFTDTKKKKREREKLTRYYPFSDWDCHTGNPVITKTIAMIALNASNASNAYLNKILVLQKRVLHLSILPIEENMPSLYLSKQKFCLLLSYSEVVSKLMFDVHKQHINVVKLFTKTSHIHTYNTPSSKSQLLLSKD